ncbi:MAG: nicotinate phosphoribosyltransferase [DPANN group archaeon]|nr:nicotinate phosphoribosyltransferase [DPANN group archaeon]
MQSTATQKLAIETAKFSLPASHEPYTDKYFLRSNQVLKGEGMNPYVKMQVFIRKGPGRVFGIEEAVAILDKYSNIFDKGKVFALPEGSQYKPGEVVMQIEGPVQEFIELETMYLGAMAGETSKRAGITLDFSQIKENARKVVEAAEGRTVMYFGARHWKYDDDAKIARAAYEGGIDKAATDIGAATFGGRGKGTSPHVAIIMFGAKYGRENASLEFTKAFDRHIDPRIKRLTLIDTFNRELSDSRMILAQIPDKVSGFRLDTCGENIGEGGTLFKGAKYETGNGVTIELVNNFYNQMKELGHPEKEIVLSSGFADAKKIAAFTAAEKRLGHKLFDGLGIGGLYNSIETKADTVEVDGMRISKAGRFFRPIERLEEVVLE